MELSDPVLTVSNLTKKSAFWPQLIRYLQK